MSLFKPKHHRVISVRGSVNRYGKGLLTYVLRYNARLWEGAICRGIDTDVFYPPQELFSRDEERMFKRMCADCPAMQACLEWGLAHERYGVWGGTTPPMRHKMRNTLGLAIADPQHNP